MAQIYSVTQINTYIKNMFAQDFLLNRINVQGEVFNCKYHPGGHIYFTLKDSGGALSAVMFASRRSGLSFTLRDGMQVVVSGSIEVYEKGGTYQIYARTIRQAGAGELYERFLKLKEKLEDMGMFDESYKQPVPKYARTVGIVTASSGAAIQDIINVAGRRNPYVQLILCSAQVQGTGAAESIVRSIRTIDACGCDVLIVGRGGGSIEDLWAFNEESVARAIFEAKTPVISAVGHETDFTIADYVADLRAPTPSAAAELAVFDYESFENAAAVRKGRLSRAMRHRVEALRSRQSRAALRLSRVSPQARIHEYRMRLEDYRMRFAQASPSAKVNTYRALLAEYRLKLDAEMNRKITGARHRLALTAECLKGVSPLEKIASGYAWVSSEQEEHLKNAAQMAPGDRITLRFADGKVKADVTEVRLDG